jgi:hypothetical protein
VLIIFEMTRGYGLVLPMMIANMSAFALASHWRHTPIYEALLEQDGIVLEDGKGPYEDATPAKQPVAQGQEMHAEETRPEEKHLDARS